MIRKSMAILLALALVCAMGPVFGAQAAGSEIVLWHPMGGLDMTYFEEMVDAYNATNPAVPVTSIVQADMYTKIYTMMSSSSTEEIPDLMVYHVERAKLFNQQGFLDSMDAAIANQPEIKAENYLEQAWAAGEIDGSRYALPLDVHSSLLIYNKDLVEQYAPGVIDDGILTFDEIKAVNEAKTDDNIVTYAMNCMNWLFVSLVTQQGGSIYDGDTPTLDTPEALKAYTQMKELVDLGCTQIDGDDPLALFQSGEAIFYQGATWDAGALNAIDGMNWGFANTPSFDTEHLSNWTSSHQFGMMKKERSPEVVEGIGAFLEFVRTHSDIWAKSGQNPASLAVTGAASYSEYPQSFLMANERERDSMTIYNFMYNGDAFSALDLVTQDIVFSRLSAEEGLAKAQKTVTDKIAESAN